MAAPGSSAGPIGTLPRLALSRRSVAILGVAVLAYGAFAAIFLPYLPNADGRTGSDFGYFVPQLMAGYFWFKQNGLTALPWFTPAFCGGTPYYPNMQGIYLSLPQFLTFAIGPIAALRATFLVMALAGYAGFYALLRRCFAVTPWIALAGAVLFLFNGFYAYRFLIGHLTFHGFMLTPLVALAVLAGARHAGWRRLLDAWVLIAGLMLGYMVQIGMVHAIPPALMAILVVILAHGLRHGFTWTPLLRFGIAGAIGLALSAGKLAAALQFLDLFPRDMMGLSGFDGIVNVIAIVVLALFFGSTFLENAGAVQVNNEWFEGTRVILGPHEFEYGITIIPALIILTWLFTRLTRNQPPAAATAKDWRIPAARAAIVAALIVPVLINWYEPAWNDFLKTLPLFENSSTLTRWFCLYTLLGCFATAVILDRYRMRPALRSVTGLGIVAAVVMLNATADRSYYENRPRYDLTAAERVYDSVAAGGPVPAVQTLDWPSIGGFTDRVSRIDRNDSLLRGRSQAECYEPMFGFRLESFPFGDLRPGSMLQANDGRLNVKNPACMVFPDANECRPGDQFRAGDISRARGFLDYRPFDFRMPAAQRMANVLSLVALIAALAGLAVFGASRLTAGPTARPAGKGAVHPANRART